MGFKSSRVSSVRLRVRRPLPVNLDPCLSCSCSWVWRSGLEIWAGDLGWRSGLEIWAGDLGWRSALGSCLPCVSGPASLLLVGQDLQPLWFHLVVILLNKVFGS